MIYEIFPLQIWFHPKENFKQSEYDNYMHQIILLVIRAEVEEFFANMDRDFDGKLSFAEFMGEETPLEKVSWNKCVFIVKGIKVKTLS